MKKFAFTGGIALCAAAFNAAASCGSAFCLVNTDWSTQGGFKEDGMYFDLRYEYIELDQPRTGRDRISVGQIPRHHDEVRTENNNLVASLDWSFAARWGLNVSLPYVDRYHEHIHNHRGEKIVETWDFRELGDARVMARYENVVASTDATRLDAWGFTFGVKLPTGKYDVKNGEGDEAERTLQPGTGTTDAVLGAYWHSATPASGVSWFTRAQVVLPMNSRADYKPGKQLLLDAGAHYAASSTVGLMLQLNGQWKDRDSGANAEPEDSGQRQVWLSPGISWNPARNTQVYAFVQVPIYQAVNGVQLTADWSAMAGVSFRF